MAFPGNGKRRGGRHSSQDQTSLPSSAGSLVRVNVCASVCSPIPVQVRSEKDLPSSHWLDVFGAQPVGLCTAAKSMKTGIWQQRGRARGRRTDELNPQGERSCSPYTHTQSSTLYQSLRLCKHLFIDFCFGSNEVHIVLLSNQRVAHFPSAAADLKGIIGKSYNFVRN